ncbi:Shikimate kinase [Agrococcus jejuensis]|uniref:Shikimate kinase n=2 Tax=Agrococcus jejuensis TaxID=399736 RepID=A0A1G8G0T2_9MICO|nr:Shikimate kinase [Agrococcus jejuensis]
MTHRTTLVTGMSATGKSTVLRALAGLGCDAVDTDEPGPDGAWIETVDGEPLWRLDRIRALLDQPRSQPLVVQGTVANQGALYDRFDAIVLLSAPADVILERLRTRTTNDFGKHADERAQVLRDLAEVEPLLRAGATHEIDATQPLDVVVAAVLTIAVGSDRA